MKSKIVIAGGSGLVGKQLADLMTRNGVEVHLVSRRPTAQVAACVGFANTEVDVIHAGKPLCA